MLCLLRTNLRTGMALQNSSIVMNSLRNFSLLTSPGFRSAICASRSRQLSYIINSDKLTHANRDLQTNTWTQRETTKNRNVIDTPWSIQIRNYAKSKNRPKKGSNKHKPEHNVELDENIVQGIIDIDKYQADLNKVLEDLKQDYIRKLSLKTSAGAFDRLQIQTEDGTVPLNQIASIMQKNPTLIILNLNQYIKYTPDVMEALRNSGMNLNPQQEGKGTIYITVSKVSHERREELAKNAKTLFSQAKEKMGHIYSLSMKKVNKESVFDVKKSLESKLLAEKSRVQGEAESLMKAKQKELLGS